MFNFVVTFFSFLQHTGSSNSSLVLALGLGDLLTAGLDAGQDVLTVLVELELGDDHVAGVDAEGHALAGGLVAGDTLNVDDVFETVDRGDLALLVLVEATNNLNLVVLADGDAPDLPRLSVGLSESASQMRIINVRCTSHGAPC